MKRTEHRHLKDEVKHIFINTVYRTLKNRVQSSIRTNIRRYRRGERENLSRFVSKAFQIVIECSSFESSDASFFEVSCLSACCCSVSWSMMLLAFTKTLKSISPRSTLFCRISTLSAHWKKRSGLFLASLPPQKH